MNNRAKFIIMLFFTVGLLSGACDDWSAIESVDINQTDSKEQNPELYATYLENLRQYKTGVPHKQVYAWFDNSVKETYSRGQHYTFIPDSIDVVSIMYPDQLSEWELQEIESVRKDKNTRFIYSIGYEALEEIHAKMVENANTEEGNGETVEEPVDFITFMVDTVQQALSVMKKYGYDGISIAYEGQEYSRLNSKELQEYKKKEKAFIGMIASWRGRHPEKILVFEGKPQNLVENSILADCDHILVTSDVIKDKYNIRKVIKDASVRGVPVDKLGIIVYVPSLDPQDTQRGYFSDGECALPAVARWISIPENDDLIGIGIYDLNSDYYNPDFVYKHTRESIAILNF